MSSEISEDQLLSIVERVERLQEERAAIAADISEIYKEAKANGYEAKAIKAVVKARAADPAARAEADALFDLYWSAIERAASRAGTCARAA